MRLSPVLLISAAGLVTFGVSQTLTPTVHAQTVHAQTVHAQTVHAQTNPAAPALRVSVQSLHTKQTSGGVEVTGKIVNTGRQALSYPAIVCVFTDAAGAEIGHADGYFTLGPVGPGQSAGFRAVAPTVPAFAKVILRLREAGQTVTVQPLAQSASRCTTVR